MRTLKNTKSKLKSEEEPPAGCVSFILCLQQTPQPRAAMGPAAQDAAQVGHTARVTPGSLGARSTAHRRQAALQGFTRPD